MPLKNSNNTSSQSANFITPTTVQESQITNQLQTKNKNNQVKQATIEASNNINGFSKIESCIFEKPERFSQYIAPGSGIYSISEINTMELTHHNRSTCLTLVRFQGWNMPARNILRYEVVYVADDSGESVKVSHELSKQPDGLWLYNR